MLMLNMFYFVVLLERKSPLDVEANSRERGDCRQTAIPAHLHKRSAVTALSHTAASLTNGSIFIFINSAVD